MQLCARIGEHRQRWDSGTCWISVARAGSTEQHGPPSITRARARESDCQGAGMRLIEGMGTPAWRWEKHLGAVKTKDGNPFLPARPAEHGQVRPGC